jgi:ferritin-like metal-binding protein YciE
MKMDSLKTLWVHELQDLWSAENQILSALPRVIDAVQDEGLRKAYKDHSKKTEKHLDRLRTIFDGLEMEPDGQVCRGMEGLLKEVDEVLGGDVDDGVIDAALVAATQRVEHYEMAGYGVARTFAEQLGESEAADLLQATLDEEGLADRTLTRLAERRLNFEAMSGQA